MKITDYEKVQTLLPQNVLLTDGDGGTKTILARDLLPALLAITNARDSLGTINVTELAQVTGIKPTDRLIVSQDGTNKGITIEDLYWSMLDEILSLEHPSDGRRNCFRGKSLGSVFTAEQKENIRNGNFRGMFLGDYWEIGGNNWRIADFDYWLDKGSTTTQTKHLVILPDKNVLGDINVPMNDTATTAGGYWNSKMKKDPDGGLSLAKTIIESAFGAENIYERVEYFTTAVENGAPVAAGWSTTKIDLPTEEMIIGHPAMSAVVSANARSVEGSQVDSIQLALMKERPAHTILYRGNAGRSSYWLRNINGPSTFCMFHSQALPVTDIADRQNGLRPVFGITG